MTTMFSPDTPITEYEKFGGTASFDKRTRMGVHVKFDNGWTVSIQFGPGTYSGNHQNMDFEGCTNPSSTAELACWKDDSGMLEWAEGDTVQGYLKWDEVQKVLKAASEDTLSEPIAVPA